MEEDVHCHYVKPPVKDSTVEYTNVIHVFDLNREDNQFPSDITGDIDKVLLSHDDNNYICYVEKVLSQDSKSDMGFVKSLSFEANIKRLLKVNDELDMPKHLMQPFTDILTEFRKITESPTDSDAVRYNTKEELVLRENPGSTPVFTSPYRDRGPAALKELQTQIQFLLSKGFIRPSRSPYGSPILFASKADGKLRMAVDYRRLNEQLVDDNYGAGKISDLFDQLSGDKLNGKSRAKYYSKMDLTWAFWQLKVSEESVEKTTITTPIGSYDWLVCPFEIKLCPRFVLESSSQHSDPIFSGFVLSILTTLLFTVIRLKNICYTSV